MTPGASSVIRSWPLLLLLIAFAPAPAAASQVAGENRYGSHLTEVGVAVQEPIRAPGSFELLRGLEREARTRLEGPKALPLVGRRSVHPICPSPNVLVAPTVSSASPRICERLPYYATAPPRS